ncbi:hypothetical protein DPMN_124983 [Dreissena polymorpha]|uniref:Uncharacterized protein n=1 Tax=Dreissena polymorpha TaxID=45954 RepID=A0A9D4GXD6_DREPO|nr:hypothetical protein DPMN_124983 [Dreissena polymorpha]
MVVKWQPQQSPSYLSSATMVALWTPGRFQTSSVIANMLPLDIDSRKCPPRSFQSVTAVAQLLHFGIDGRRMAVPLLSVSNGVRPVASPRYRWSPGSRSFDCSVPRQSPSCSLSDYVVASWPPSLKVHIGSRLVCSPRY